MQGNFPTEQKIIRNIPSLSAKVISFYKADLLPE
jgi:hypothetical protein